MFMFEQILIVGYGRIAEVLYVPYLQQKKYNIVVCEKNKERHQLIKKSYPEVTITDEIPLPSKRKKCAAINLTPVQMHEEINAMLLEKNWSVFTEKIAAESTCAWNRLIAISKKNNCTIVSAPVSANFEQENQMAHDLSTGAIGDVLEVHCQFIGGGPARRGWISEYRKWMLQSNDAIRVDLAPYLLTPTIKIIGAVENIKWFSNRYHPVYPIRDRKEKLKSVCGTSELGVGNIGESIATFLVAYRPNINDVITRIEIVGTKSTKMYNLAETVNAGSHVYTRVEAGLNLLSECCSNDKTCSLHHQLVSTVIHCLKIDR